MPHLKPKLTNITILALGAANIYTASLAQDAGSQTDTELSTEAEAAPKISDIFIGADLDGDGALGPDEHRLYLDNGAPDSAPDYDEAFYSLAFSDADKDGDGLVTYLEITSVLDGGDDVVVDGDDMDEDGRVMDIPQDE